MGYCRYLAHPLVRPGNATYEAQAEQPDTRLRTPASTMPSVPCLNRGPASMEVQPVHMLHLRRHRDDLDICPRTTESQGARWCTYAR